MSSLTRCNYCTLQDMVKRANSRGARVTIKPEMLGDVPWLAVYDEDRPNAIGYFMQLPTECAC
jgi:hypothetical protein